MNENIIKMFIGGEEVVSNKEFTINEEMLSASSTILNNCYPASWEESKDYVSNFYYPKDYSKFILGKGNFTYGTDQYSILSVSGETFMQFTTNVEKEWNSFDVYGNTYQATRSGKNLFKNNDFNGTNHDITFSNINNSLNISGTSTATYYPSVVMYADGSYSILNWVATTSNINAEKGYFNDSGNIIISIFQSGNRTGQQRAVIGYEDNTIDTYYLNSTDFATKTYTTNKRINFICIANHPNQTYNVTFKIMISKSGGDYEPYGQMPSPDYPSELVSVGYENLFDKQKNYTYTNVAGTWTITQLETGLRLQTSYTSGSPFITFVLKDLSNLVGKTVQVTANFEVSGNRTARYLLGLCNADGSNRTEKVYSDINGNTVSFIVPELNGQQTYLYLALRSVSMTGSSADDYIDYTNIVVSIGTQTHSYIPYGKYGIEVKTTGKNLFNLETKEETLYGVTTNINHSEIVFNGTKSANSNTIAKTSIGTLKAGKYTFSYSKKSGAYTSLSDEFTLYAGSTKVVIISLKRETYTNSFTIDTDTEMFAQYWVNSGSSFNNYDIVFQLEENTQATDYEPYIGHTNLIVLDNPLRSIGDTKDLLYIENGMLYVDRKIGIIVLNGTESEWVSLSTTTGLYRYNLSYSNLKPGYKNALCNYFTMSDETSFANITSVSFATHPSNQLFCFFTNEITLDNWKNWLSTHNTEVQYVLDTPYTEEIGQVNIPYSYEGINNITFDTGIDTEETIYYYWKNYDILFAGIVKNSGDISLRPTNPKYCSLQILDYKTFLSESDTLDFVISDKTIAEAISMVVDAISGYGFVLGTIEISQADDIIGAYSTLNKTAYDVFQYLANISGSRWRARFVDSDTMAIDFYDPELLPRANDIDYTQQYWEDNKIVDLTFNYGTRDYRNKQIILSDEVYGGIDYTEVLLSNGYGTSYITQNNIANITSITVNGVEAEVITQSEKDLGVDADFYYTPGKNVVESTISYTAGTQIIITYTPLVKGRQIVYNDEEVTRIATQTNTTGVISRYENRNDILSSDELENIAKSYIKYKGKPEIILKLTTLNNDLFNIGEICYFNSPIADLAQDYMVKSKATNYTSVAGETNIFYTYELTSSFNSEKAINYFDNQRNKATGNIAEGESITRNIDINNSAMIIWENATITEISVSVDGDNALNSVLNSPFIQ